MDRWAIIIRPLRGLFMPQLTSAEMGKLNRSQSVIGSQKHRNPRGLISDFLVTVNLTVDSSLDGDKLGKQLELLRKFGLI